MRTSTGNNTARRGRRAGRMHNRGGWRAVGATRPRAFRASTGALTRASAPGFTLTEVLIVIGLIVVIIALAVPAFNAMTGGRSVDAATNTLSAMLGRVRMEAIGLQEPRGLMFYRDPATERVASRIVRFAGSDPSTGIPGIDLVEDRDPMLLPVGVGLQMVDDAEMTGSGAGATARDDRYIGFNDRLGTHQFENNGSPFRVGGVILFDQNGRLSSRPYGFRVKEPGKRPNQLVLSEMGRLLFGEQASGPGGNNQVIHNVRAGGANSLQSQFGFVLYDEEPFRNQTGFNADDPQMGRGGNITQAERAEEAWLDQNAVPILINRYNGTLIRGE